MQRISPKSSKQKSRAAEDRLNSEDLFQFQRFSHIFASVVRELLEKKLLEEVSPYPLSLSQFHLLKLISLNGQHQVGEVADFLGVSSPAATKNIDKLERLELVSRTPSTGDRRAILLESSRAGRRLVKKYEDLKTKRLGSVMEAFSSADLRQLTRLLERFSMALIMANENQDGLCFRCSAYFDEHCPIMRLREDCPYQKVWRSRESVVGKGVG
jgi:DNA-binding MarR family transcriptional regulator